MPKFVMLSMVCGPKIGLRCLADVSALRLHQVVRTGPAAESNEAMSWKRPLGSRRSFLHKPRCCKASLCRARPFAPDALLS
eukprot:2075011-Alexandrium_andersonii.AAC.1